jgi:hypothetical protein
MIHRHTHLLQWLALGVLAAVLLLAQGCGGGGNPSRLTFFVTGKTLGYLENCGCSGGQAGGMHRRATAIRFEREEIQRPLPSDGKLASETLTIDVGDFSDPEDVRQKLRSKGVVRAMDLIGYDSVGLGMNELNYTQLELVELLSEAKALPFTAANVEFVKPDMGEDASAQLTELVSKYRIVKTKSGYRVGIIHVVDNSGVLRGEPISSGFKLNDPIEAASAILSEHKKEADFWTISVGSVEQYGIRNEELQKLPGVQLVFGVRGYQPNNSGEGIQFPYFIEKPMDKGKDVTRVTATFAERNQLRIEALKLAIREDIYKPDKQIQDEVITPLLPDLKSLENQIAEEELEKHKVNTASGPLYVGHTSCAQCHSDIAVQLADSKHMHAYETLVKLDRHRDSCAKCHNVGFNKAGGFNVIDDAKISGDWVKRNVQCENCHGPGEFHVKLHMNSFKHPKLTQEGRNAQGLLPVTEATCQTCHDTENSPNFNYKKYWPHIQHGNGLKPVPGSPAGSGMGGGGHHGEPSRGMGGSHSRRDDTLSRLHALL